MATKNLPALMGAGATFFGAPKTAMFAPGIVDLDRITQRTLIGWIYGGIVSSKPHTGADDAAAQITDASAMAIPVYAEKKTSNCVPAK